MYIKFIGTKTKQVVLGKSNNNDNNFDSSNIVDFNKINNQDISNISVSLILTGYDNVDNVVNNIRDRPMYKLKIIGKNNQNCKQVKSLLLYVMKDTLNNNNIPEYAWYSGDLDEIKYFNICKISAEDGSCALASIYKIIGSNEVGAVARAKAVQQLKNNMHDQKVIKLIQSEVRGILLSTELIKLPIFNKLTTRKTNKLIAKYKNYVNKYTNLKKQLSSNLYNIDSTLTLEVKNKLMHLEKQVANLEQEIFEIDSNIDTIAESLSLYYVDHIISSSGYWLAVAGGSSGVMGAIAQINDVNYRLLIKNGNILKNNLQEMVKVGEHISINMPNMPIHYIHLHSDPNMVIEMQELSFHFDILRETFLSDRCVTTSDLLKRQASSSNQTFNAGLDAPANSSNQSFNVGLDVPANSSNQSFNVGLDVPANSSNQTFNAGLDVPANSSNQSFNAGLDILANSDNQSFNVFEGQYTLINQKIHTNNIQQDFNVSEKQVSFNQQLHHIVTQDQDDSSPISIPPSIFYQYSPGVEQNFNILYDLYNNNIYKETENISTQTENIIPQFDTRMSYSVGNNSNYSVMRNNSFYL